MNIGMYFSISLSDIEDKFNVQNNTLFENLYVSACYPLTEEEFNRSISYVIHHFVDKYQLFENYYMSDKYKCKVVMKISNWKHEVLKVETFDGEICNDGTLKVLKEGLYKEDKTKDNNINDLSWVNCKEIVIKKLLNKINCNNLEEFERLKKKIGCIDKLIEEFDKLE